MKRIHFNILSIILLVFFTSISFSQDNPNFSYDDVFVLERERAQRVDEFAANNNVSLIKQEGDVIYEIYDIVDGRPIYRSTDNAGAAANTFTNSLHPSGSLGLSLEGEGMIVGVWEVGGISRVTHQEYSVGGQSRLIIQDGSSNVTFHSTHVTGTIAASGVNPEAKGMAPKSTIWNYSAAGVESEIVQAIFQSNMLLSNHSYGVPIIQENGPLPPQAIGSYNNAARAWDLIANNHPFHLAVFSAGNNGEDTNPDPLLAGYDKLTGEKNSKNNLVVANVASVTYFGDLVISNLNTSSSQGPSDDGRIKPDIGGMGSGIFSTAQSADNSYGTASGTSMAAPQVSGSLLLLQELFHDQYDEYMKSSTLKALALNTASDAGNVGPDALYGWGILNSEKAANVILDRPEGKSNLELITLADGETFSFQVTAKGGEDVKAMIVWNDPAGTAINNVVNSPTPALVNDLDLRVKIGSEEFFPWKLQLSDVSAPAIKGDNIVDNVEQVIVGSPSEDDVYTIEITHKGTLVGGEQEVSIVVTGIKATTLSNDTFEVDCFENVSVWPNPLRDVVNINFAQFMGEDVQVEVYDLLGRKVINQKFTNVNQSLQFNASSLTKGTYILKLSSNSQSYTQKIIKK